MIPEKGYHATYKQFLNSIKRKGLGNTKKKMWSDSFSGVVYFANNPDVAESYAEEAEGGRVRCCHRIVLFKIEYRQKEGEGAMPSPFFYFMIFSFFSLYSIRLIRYGKHFLFPNSQS